MDWLDEAILDCLHTNQGEQCCKIAEALNEPKSKIWYRLRGLERAGLVRLERGKKSLRCYTPPVSTANKTIVD